MARGLKMFVRLIWIKKERLRIEKSLTGAIYKEQKLKNGDKKSS